MLKKNLSIIFIILIFIFSTIFIIPHDKSYKIVEVESPISFILNDRNFIFNDLGTFDADFTLRNQNIAKSLEITETEAFILGNLAKYWSSNLMKGRKVFIKNNSDLIYDKHSYRLKFLYSGFCLIDSKPYYKKGFEKRIKEIRHANYKILDIDTDKIYEINDRDIATLKNYILIKNSHIPQNIKQQNIPLVLDYENIKVCFSDLTRKFKADRNCSSDICKEILNNINKSQDSIDIAIYGYSKVPEIENALQKAISRGVKIRLIYDTDSNGKNIYPDTDRIVSLIKLNNCDKNSAESRNIMHNKFYIFDNKILITGSANLSHTDMSGFNSNSIIVINSTEISKVYQKEFEQMYAGKFHSDKISQLKQKFSISGTDIEVYFSPQDKSITNAVIPLIQKAKQYIYIPTFVLTEKRVTEELIKAKNRGVDVKIIMDALNASIRHSKHNELRLGKIPVKTENFAGKMHSKSMIIDDKYTIIGSMNFSNRGENKNDENIVVIKNPKIANFYKNFFIYQWNKIDNKWLKQNVRAESKDSIGSCFDGIDNNYDGLIDSEDPACKE